MKKTVVDRDTVAIFIAFLAVVLTLWQGYELRQHNRKAVMPGVNDFQNRELTKEPWIELGFKSVGLGPAKVKQFEVFFNGKQEQLIDHKGFETYFNDTMVAVRGAVNESDAVSRGSSRLEQGQLLPPGEEVILLKLRYNGIDTSQEFRRVTGVIDHKLDIFVCYCSVYDDQCEIAHIGKNKSLAPKVCE